MSHDEPRGGRTAQQVLDDHLERARQGDLDGDLERNYAEDVVLLLRDGAHRGHAAARELARLLAEQVPTTDFTYLTAVADGEVGLLRWTARAGDRRVDDGVDSFVIRDGLIRAQTISYTVREEAAVPGAR